MNNQEIQEYLRLPYPFSFIDTVEYIEPGKVVKAYKYFTENEWLFHCSANGENQKVPFTMVIEILSAMCLLPVLVLDNNKGKVTNSIAADEAHVYRQIHPGDCLELEAEILSYRRGIAVAVGKGYVDHELACEAKFKFVIPDILEHYKPKVSKDS